LKNALIEHLKMQGHECLDFGTKSSEQKVDYPLMGEKVAASIIEGAIQKGVLVCGTGIGISLAANKVPGIRAAVCSEPYSAKLSVEHNNANIISVGARVVGEELAKMIVDAFFSATFQKGRHENRVNLITQIEQKYSK
ncbi:MAG: ribose 5-phosphate isomerase B, partial [Treponema sp.]|nr:ribose 5-phosphate isomerase B [Treponema sp.]